MNKYTNRFLSSPVLIFLTIVVWNFQCSHSDHKLANELLFGFFKNTESSQVSENQDSHDLEFKISNIDPPFVNVNSSFTVEGKGFKDRDVNTILGQNVNKLFTLTYQDDTKLKLTVVSCPSETLTIPISSNSDSEDRLTLTCFDSFSYSKLPKILVWKEDMEVLKPIPNLNSFDPIVFLNTLGIVEFKPKTPFPPGFILDPVTGEISGKPEHSTENEMITLSITANLKENPKIYVDGFLRLIVVTDEEKEGRTCYPIESSSTCPGSSNYRCQNASVCFSSEFRCKTNLLCGF